jgi:DNA (cytosine-5)-methyltransferase 1
MPSDSEVPATSNRRPVAIDLFAGAGGLSLGFEEAGFDVFAAVEYDPIHAAAHEFNFPQTETICADISSLSPSRLLDAARRGAANFGAAESWDGEVDVIFGGPPCQGFSNIGKRLVDDPRNQLVFHFFRLIRELKPRYFLMENVPGMRAGGHAGILHQLIAEFESSGYKITQPYRILNAADFGVPQDRKRLIVLGAREDQEAVEYPAPTVRRVAKRGGGAASDVPTDLPLGPTVGNALGDLPDADQFPLLLESAEVPLSEEQSLLADEVALGNPYARSMRGLRREPANLATLRRWNRATLTSSMRTVHTERSINRFRSTKPGETESVSRFYRPDPDGLSNTLRAGTGSERGAYTSPRPIHPALPRVITVREAARLHSFPDWFQFHETKWHGFRQIGNAVAPRMGRAVARQFILALNVSPARSKRRISLGDRRLLSFTMSQGAEYFGADRSEIPATRKRIKVAA